MGLFREKAADAKRREIMRMITKVLDHNIQHLSMKVRRETRMEKRWARHTQDPLVPYALIQTRELLLL